jgi:hypothetical protein
VNYPARNRKTVLCLIEGCGALAETKGRCNKHYNSWRKANGSLEVAPEENTHFTKCVKKNCRRCAELKEACEVHIETPARIAYTYPGDEQSLEKFGEK